MKIYVGSYVRIASDFSSNRNLIKALSPYNQRAQLTIQQGILPISFFPTSGLKLVACYTRKGKRRTGIRGGLKVKYKLEFMLILFTKEYMHNSASNYSLYRKDEYLSLERDL